MSRRRALVVHTRMPAADRDSGSQDIDNTIQFLLRAGWHVTFLAREERTVTEERHAQRLRQLGVATHNGFGGAERLMRSNRFDLAVVAFWEPAAELLPLLRAHSPHTRVVINSIDLHFLRNARRAFGRRDRLDASFGGEAAGELNTYNAADAVLVVSDKERDLLSDFLGEGRAFTLPLAEDVPRSPHPLEDRRGMCFVGNFRHLPNREAVEHLCNDVLPLLDPALLARHPLTVLGNWLDRVELDVPPDPLGVHLVGWVPSVQPYADRARLAVVPLLHGAGVKRKVIQSMMGGTPVVTTPVGADGLELVQGVHALIGLDAADLAAGISRLLTDDDLWHRLADAGLEHAVQRHSIDLVERRFAEIIETVMERAPEGEEARRSSEPPTGGSPGSTDPVRRRLQTLGSPSSVVLVAVVSEDDVVELGTRPVWPFPQSREGGWAGYEPVDGPAAVTHLEAQRARGAHYFVLPRKAFSWRHRYPELFDHLEASGLRVHQDEHMVVWDVGRDRADDLRLDPLRVARVRVIGTYAAHRAGPPSNLVQELGSSDHLVVDQSWRTDAELPTEDEPVDADYVVHVRDDAILPGRFLDTLIATQVTLGTDRLQPTHVDGPSGGPPITERHAGTVAREIDEPTALPVLSLRAGVDPRGPVALADNLSVGLRRPLLAADPGNGFVRRTWVQGAAGRPVVHARREPTIVPRISVLVATYERPGLLRSCLASFAKQTLDRSEYEVVVVDDGSCDDTLAEVLAEVADDLQVVGLRIAHAGRSAAKNHAVMLARAPIVLFFDDDDRAAPDYLERHLDGHAARPEEAVAILGHTDWAPELELTPLMHYVTDVDRLMFAYERLADGQVLDWRGFWEGRISCKRSLLLRHGLHDQRLNYSIDVEMGWRLAPAGLRVIYTSAARSLMARPLDFEAFCDRTVAKGRAHAVIAALHAGTEMAARLQLEGAATLWEEKRHTEPTLRQRVATLEGRCLTDDRALPELHAAYREVFRLLHAKGAVGVTDDVPRVSAPPVTVRPLEGEEPALVRDGTPADQLGDPMISIAIPVWSRTSELADMAKRTIERIWEVAQVPTEVVVVDNGSPHEIPLAARVHRYDQNRGVSVGWNTGIRLSRAPMVVVMNSDCRVEPGWDVALFEAASNGRRVAFPFTDHCDGRGSTQPDQGGTAGWCFMLSRAIYDEVGPFDEWFSPAFCEDTDYWHRAWDLGIELSPVPAARVVHARRTTSAGDDHEMLLQAHRYKYGWKHGVDPHRAPPYYNREVVDYVGTFRVPDPRHRPGRPRVFGIGLNKTGTSSLHEAFQMLRLESLHWGGPAIRQLVEASRDAGDPLLSRLDQRFDAFSDIQVLSSSFEQLDQQYPGSRFILTVRPVDDWIESRRRHVEVNRQRQAVGDYTGHFVDVDEAAWRSEWHEHVGRVRSYFAGRDEFLEVDLTELSSWSPLCQLLDVPEPRGPFPWANRSLTDR
ncbi:MAG: glycosyltransferase [Acidimicrobiales bacterium]